MSKRTVSVEATVSFDYVIDDEAVSDWDGKTILDLPGDRMFAQPPVYTAGATLDDLLGHLGVLLCVEGRMMGNLDGWADFPAEAASGSPFGVHWEIDSVDVSIPEPTS